MSQFCDRLAITKAMVVRPSSLPRESPEKTNKSTSSSTTASSNGSGGAGGSGGRIGVSPKHKHTFNSMSRKHVSMSPSPPVTRSKSMSGLSRLDTNKINGNGEYGRLKREISPLNQIGTAINHSYSNGSTPNLTKTSSRGYESTATSQIAHISFAHIEEAVKIQHQICFPFLLFFFRFNDSEEAEILQI